MNFVPSEINTSPPRKRRAPSGAIRTGPKQGALQVAATCHFVAQPRASGKCFRCQFPTLARRALTATLAQALGECLARIIVADSAANRSSTLLDIYSRTLRVMTSAKRRSRRWRRRTLKGGD